MIADLFTSYSRRPRRLCAGLYPGTGVYLTASNGVEYRSGPARQRAVAPQCSTLLRELLLSADEEIRAMVMADLPGRPLVICYGTAPVLIALPRGATVSDGCEILGRFHGIAAAVVGETLIVSDAWTLRDGVAQWDDAGSVDIEEQESGRFLVRFRWTSAPPLLSAGALLRVTAPRNDDIQSEAF